MIPDAMPARFSWRIQVAQARNAHSFFVLPALLLLISTASVAFPMAASQDQNAKPPTAQQSPGTPASQQPPAAQQSPAAPPKPSSPSPTVTTPLKKAVHQKKVITEEDLAKPAKAISLSDLEGEENNPLCDLSCEAELREQLGFGREREAEFRNQMTLARHEIGDDKVWNYTLQDALKTASQYCDLQRQKAEIVSKGAVSQAVRDNVNATFSERERKITSQYRESSGLLTQRMQEVQRFAPFRATVMQYQVTGTIARVCPEFPLP